MDEINSKVLDACEDLHVTVKACLEKYGIEVTLEALSEQFGITGATAVIAGVMPPSHFAGVYILRSITVCNQLCKDNYVQGVM